MGISTKEGKTSGVDGFTWDIPTKRFRATHKKLKIHLIWPSTRRNIPVPLRCLDVAFCVHRPHYPVW